MKLEVVTPERRVVNETVDSVTVPTLSGEIGILPNHAPLISGLSSGILSYAQGGTTKKMVVSGGFLEVGDDEVSVLADSAEFANEVNVEKARQERDELEKTLGSFGGSEDEMNAVKEKLERAEAQLQLASGK